MTKKETEYTLGSRATLRFTKSSGATEELLTWINQQPGPILSKLMKSVRVHQKLTELIGLDSTDSEVAKNLLRDVETDMLFLKYGSNDSPPSIGDEKVVSNQTDVKEVVILKEVINNRKSIKIVSPTLSTEKEKEAIKSIGGEKTKGSEGEIIPKKGGPPMRSY